MQNKQILFKIEITNNFQLKCSSIDSNNEETILKLREETEIYTPCIQFDENKITFCEETDENAIHFIKEWITQPDEYKIYQTNFQGKYFEVIAEVLFSLPIKKFISQIEKENVICQTLVYIPTRDSLSIKRIQISLESIGLKDIDINPFTFDYIQQGDVLYEMIEMNDSYEKYQRMINRAKQMKYIPKKNKIFEKYQNHINSEESFRKMTTKEFTTQERTILKMYELDNYCIFLASKHLNNLEDHQNLSMVSKRIENNMEKFHYNPISLNRYSLKFFPNVETLHIYSQSDEFLSGGRIQKYVYWNYVTLAESKSKKNYHKYKTVEFKKIDYTNADVYNEFRKNDYYGNFSITIPKEVKTISSNAFNQYGYKVMKISVENEFTQIPQNCFNCCSHLTSISIPLNKTRVIYGNKILNNKPCFDESIILPDSIKIINGNKVDFLTSLTIPSFVVLIGKQYLSKLRFHLKKLVIPDSINEKLDYSFIYSCSQLTSISLPLNETRVIYGNKIFNNLPCFSESIQLPNSIRKINDISVEPLTSLIVPSFVTSFENNCFNNINSQLKNLSLPQSYTSFSRNYFLQFIQLEQLTLSTQFKYYDNKLFTATNGVLSSIMLPKTMKSVNGIGNQILKSVTIPTQITKLNQYCFSDSEQLSSIQGLEHVKKIEFGNFFNCKKLDIRTNSILSNWYDKLTLSYFNYEELNYLENLCALSCDEIIFDSYFDNWSQNHSILNERIIGKSQLLFLIEDTEGYAFGYYLKAPIIEYYDIGMNVKYDNSLMFRLRSKNGKADFQSFHLNGKHKRKGYVLYDKYDKRLIKLSDIEIMKQNYAYSTCSPKSLLNLYNTDYICGKNEFQVKRIVVFQMK